MNPFEIDFSDIQFLFDSAGQTVKINDVERIALITNAKIGDFEDKYIHTIEPIQRGNLVDYEGKQYLIVSESAKRHVKYKALMRKCTHTISILVKEGEQVQVGETPWGDPIYETIGAEYDDFPCIVEQEKITIENGAIRTVDTEIFITLQDNEFTRKIKVNDEYEVAGYTYRVVNVNYTKSGLIILKCETA